MKNKSTFLPLFFLMMCLLVFFLSCSINSVDWYPQKYEDTEWKEISAEEVLTLWNSYDFSAKRSKKVKIYMRYPGNVIRMKESYVQYDSEVEDYQSYYAMILMQTVQLTENIKSYTEDSEAEFFQSADDESVIKIKTSYGYWDYCIFKNGWAEVYKKEDLSTFDFEEYIFEY